MRVLLVGAGGREHALAWALAKSPRVSALISAPGNPGMEKLGECVPVDAQDIVGITELATSRGADLVVVGPEAPLVAGLSDSLERKGVATFGPTAGWARLEGSKSFAKGLMSGLGIPTARYETFDRSSDAIAYVEQIGAAVAVKADGLAEGKGVSVCESVEDAKRAIVDAIDKRRFGDGGSRVVVEERLEGEELSVLAFCDGKTILPMEAAQDFKRAFDGDFGPNTGGMGSYSPVPACTPEIYGRIISQVFGPLAGAIQRSEEPYVGVIYAGLMLTSDGPKVVEFNCRFGDPETQALLPRLSSDLVDVISACVDGSLAGMKLSWLTNPCVSVVAASGGYPGEYEKGFEVGGIDEAEALRGVIVFQAGTAKSNGSIVTAGGRVLAVSSVGESLRDAAARTYEALERISFEKMWYRADIAKDKLES